MDLPCTRRVEPVHQSPRTRMYRYFTHGTVPLRALAHPARLLLPTIFAGCRLPSTTIPVGACAVTRVFPALVVLLSRPTGCPALLSYCERWLQVRLGCIRLSLSCPCRLLHTFQLSPASEACPRL